MKLRDSFHVNVKLVRNLFALENEFFLGIANAITGLLVHLLEVIWAIFATYTGFFVTFSSYLFVLVCGRGYHSVSFNVVCNSVNKKLFAADFPI